MSIYFKDELIYSNFCLEDDFLHLKGLKIDVKDKIVICKYGKIFRGNKVTINFINYILYLFIFKLFILGSNSRNVWRKRCYTL